MNVFTCTSCVHQGTMPTDVKLSLAKAIVLTNTWFSLHHRATVGSNFEVWRPCCAGGSAVEKCGGHAVPGEVQWKSAPLDYKIINRDRI